MTKHVTPLSAFVWVIVAAGCAIALLQRSGVNTGVVVQACTAMTGLFLLGYGFFRWRQPGAPGKALVATALAFFAVQVISFFVNDLNEVKLYNNQVLFLFAIPGMLIVIRADRSSRDELLALAYRVSCAVVYLSLALAVIMPSLAFGSRVGDERRWKIFGLVERLSGITPHQNLLAVTAIIATLLALHIRPKAWWLTLVLSMVAIVLSEARNAAVTAIAVLALYWLLSGRFSAPRLLAGSVGGALIYSFATAVLSGEASDLTAGASNLNNRSEIWDAVLSSWDSSFVLGFGPTSFILGSGSPFSNLGYYNAHNQFIEAVAEGGLLGSIAQLAFLVVLGGIAWRNRSEPLYLCLLFTMLASSITEVFFTVHQYGVSYAAIPAFLVLIVFSAASRPNMRCRPTNSSTGGSAAAPRSSAVSVG